ncbi:MAG: SEC-C metal-binding domain-containing protein, partial [Dongiaceae bacterium]
NREMVRIDHEDEVYRTKAEKYAAVLKLIQEAHSRKQPILVGTASIEKSEELSGILKKKGIKHEVLNARHHEREAAIIAQAGKPGAVTIATNMAGRGTDIQLGGNLSMMIKEEEAKQIGPLSESRIATLKEEIAKAKEAALAAGGLFIIGTERHESRRIDNQLRGRSGRQGDPGASKFFLSLEDDLMRIFGSERIQGLLGKMGLRDGEAITHPWITRALEKAQQKVEARNFDIRKHLLREDDVMNDQRRVIYQQRREIMESDDVSGMLAEMRQEVIGDMLRRFMPRGSIPEQWDIHALEEEGKRLFASDFPFANWAKEEGVDEEVVQERITKIVEEKMAAKLARYGAGLWHGVEKWQLLRIVDHSWKDHLLALDYLKQGTRLSAYAQRDPLIEYKREAFNLFENMLAALRELAVASLARAEINPATVEAWQQAESQSRQSSAITPPPNFAMPDKNAAARMQYSGPAKETPINEPHQSREAGAAIDPLNPATWGRVQRNAPCPCGSGKKYKHCHGAG